MKLTVAITFVFLSFLFCNTETKNEMDAENVQMKANTKAFVTVFQNHLESFKGLLDSNIKMQNILS